MINKTGIVDKVARHGKAFTLVGESLWYTAFAASQLSGAVPGDEVQFTFQESVKAGTTWNNIKNDIKVLSHGGGTVVLPSGGGTSTATPAAVFGAMTISKDRSIARQNACNVAANIIKDTSYLKDFRDVIGDEDESGVFNAEKLANAVLDVARIIEAYTTGDLDKDEALAKIEAESDAE